MAKISIVGCGKLGSVMAAVYATKGHSVIACDINPDVVEDINKGIAPVEETGLQDLLYNEHLNLRATTDIADAVLNTDVTMIIVPTPSLEDGSFDNSYVISALNEIGTALKEKDSKHLIIVNSTVMPGATIGPLLETIERASNKFVGEEIQFVYSPEFIALGSIIKDMLNPDIVLIGEYDEESGNVAQELLMSVVDNQPEIYRMNPTNAEITKISINTYLVTKITFANTVAMMCEEILGASARTVLEAVGADSRIGKKYIMPGTAAAGPCLPRDSRAFSVAMGDGFDALPSTVDIVNNYQISRLFDIIMDSDVRSVSILGLSYKTDTSVYENSTGYLLAKMFEGSEVEVSCYDPVAKPEDVPLKSLTDCLYSDAIVIATPWPQFNCLAMSNKLVIDCWGNLDTKYIKQSRVFTVGEGLDYI